MARDNRQPDYDELLRMYGEAMMRIGGLEAKVADLTNHPETQEDVPAPRSRGTSAPVSAELQALADKIDTPGQRMTGSGERSPDPDGEPREELSQLRVRISSMANQLTVAQNELAKLQKNRKHRPRKSQTVPWWKALVRRMGLGKSRRL